MTKLTYVIALDDVLVKEQDTWDAVLYSITPEWKSWTHYASDNGMDLLISNEVGNKFNVHAVQRREWNTMNINRIKSLQELQRVKLRTLVL